MNPLDKIFNERLSDHTVSPSPAAWDRIEAGLTKKNNGMVWLRWAAILVPAVAAAALWYDKPVETSTVASNSTTKAQVPASVAIPSTVDTQRPVVVIQPAKSEKIAKAVTRKRNEPVPVREPQQEPEVAAVQPEAIAIGEVSIEPAVDITTPSVEAGQEAKPIVLVFTLEPVAVPDEGDKKATSLERVVEFARTVKHSDPLGELRVMKDEFLAFDLRKKSTKKN